MKKKLTVPLIDQTDRWPTGCESVSAVMVLKYLGIDISVDRFIQDFLPKRPMYLTKSAALVGDVCIGTGPDPDEYFAGDPYSEAAFGCYPGVIVKACNAVFKSFGAPLRAVDVTGAGAEVYRRSIDNGMPVIYWATLCFEPAVYGPKWQIAGTGRTLTWHSREHCLVLTGYDDENNLFFFNDPWDHHGEIAVSQALCEKRHLEQGGRAVLIEQIKKFV
ncbi:MAG: hypothetical protein DUD26_02130 [Eubacteriaceae bacterium]|uniref:Peptidase C39-like domain-containing protein n=1 Tax=Candidatus Pseudoramibacter fermentans TaxID=2594427 RepID=A0A6L5GRG9_9FIRM|nr:hypothetical protein [Candidatus Pseudoramibacter fermentans]RRF93978.1 MAG: hypothetical protein DUD26_02130 [Eubacteriaceae bacterium]